MPGVCPIAGYSVNEKAARVNAVLTLVILIIFVFTPVKWVIFILLADLFLRCFGGFSCSPFNKISMLALDIAKVRPLVVDAAPKLFAAKIGFVLCLFICILFLLKCLWIAVLLATLFLFFVILEVFWGFCIGCKVYSLLKK